MGQPASGGSGKGGGMPPPQQQSMYGPNVNTVPQNLTNRFRHYGQQQANALPPGYSIAQTATVGSQPYVTGPGGSAPLASFTGAGTGGGQQVGDWSATQGGVGSAGAPFSGTGTGGNQQVGSWAATPGASGKAGQQPPPQQTMPGGGKGGQQPPPQGGGMPMPGGKGMQQQGPNNGLTTFTPQGGPQQYGNASPLPYANFQGGPWGGWNQNPNPWGVPNWRGGDQHYAPPPSNPIAQPPATGGGSPPAATPPAATPPAATPPAATPPPPAAPPQQNHMQNFQQLFAQDPALAYRMTMMGGAQPWFQQNQNQIRNQFFGGDQQRMNQWLNDSNMASGRSWDQDFQSLARLGYTGY